MSTHTPLRKLTVAAGRETIGFITEYSRRGFAAYLASGERVGALFRSSADAAQALSNSKGMQASSNEGGAK
jgi:hypothetical protein